MLLTPIVEIFCDIDDFCKEFLQKQSPFLLPNPERIRDKQCQMSISEIMTIIVLFQMGHYRTFKYFYQRCILQDLRPLFSKCIKLYTFC